MNRLIKKLWFTMVMIGFWGVLALNLNSFVYAQQACDFVGCPDEQLTNDPTINDVGDNPLSQGAGAVSNNIEWIKNDEASNSTQAQNNLLMYVKTIVDYLLGFLALAVLLYFLWGGYEMVTAAGDENKYSGGVAKMKRGLIAIVGIWVSWYIISIIFHIVGVGVA